MVKSWQFGCQKNRRYFAEKVLLNKQRLRTQRIQSLCCPVFTDIGESLSAYLQADYNITHGCLYVNTFYKKNIFFLNFFI